ncbi:hypothetical protein [Microbulbifer hainanensis]|uniref:hypothetical protein n=1 Tax=Microbulbifer hainanensis TaxID=2735675 RepID=UPI00186951C2|nr:hypothetical protein [Microbulbifer hainanensis]
MKKLLLPLIILLLIIGYFMSRGGDHAAKDAYDSLEKPKSESMENESPDENMQPPPDGMGTPDSNMQQESDRPDTTPPGDQSQDMMDKAKEAADTMGEKVEGAAKEAGEAVEGAADKAGEAMKDAGEATKDATEDAMDKLRDKDKESDTSDEPQN